MTPRRLPKRRADLLNAPSETPAQILQALSLGSQEVGTPGTSGTAPGSLFPVFPPEKSIEREPRESDTQPVSPIKRGWLIAYRDRGRLCGGADDREAGTVIHTVFDGITWRFGTRSGVLVRADQVRSVAQTNERGEVISAWKVKDDYDGKGKGCGLDGTKSEARPFLKDLSPKDRQSIQDAFQLSDETFTALSTGN